MNEQKYYTLNLDELFGDSYYYTDYDLSESGHSITIHTEDKDKFLDQFASIWRERASELLLEDDDFQEEILDGDEEDYY